MFYVYARLPLVLLLQVILEQTTSELFSNLLLIVGPKRTISEMLIQTITNREHSIKHLPIQSSWLIPRIQARSYTAGRHGWGMALLLQWPALDSLSVLLISENCQLIPLIMLWTTLCIPIRWVIKFVGIHALSFETEHRKLFPLAAAKWIHIYPRKTVVSVIFLETYNDQWMPQLLRNQHIN